LLIASEKTGMKFWEANFFRESLASAKEGITAKIDKITVSAGTRANMLVKDKADAS